MIYDARGQFYCEIVNIAKMRIPLILHKKVKKCPLEDN